MKMLLSAILSRIVRHGELCVSWPDQTASTFTGTDGPRAGFRLTNWQTVRRLVLNPPLAFGEAYMDGALQPEECSLYELLDFLMLNLGAGKAHPLMRWHQVLRRLTRSVRQINDAARAQRRVAHHYDLDSRLYTLFLDADQQYSCAYFPHGEETLEEAQRAKKRLIATKLHLNRPDLTVLDIGCGWGGLALTLAVEYGARVTGITLSTEQLALAQARAEAAGLADRVQFRLADYRVVTGRFDRVVSVGMLEHVGVVHYNTFFQVVRNRLTPDGVALIHHIGRTDGPGASGAWLQKYIFPGGYVPALSEVTPAIERNGLIVTDLEVLRLHYARTLRLWRERFASNRDAIRDLYDERFCRMFEFYLAGAELSFRRDRDVVYQFQLSSDLNTLPFSRDYMLAGQSVANAKAEKAVGGPERIGA
jgi:cyclopropane-fatty-acyl-phospholipid synthase